MMEVSVRDVARRYGITARTAERVIRAAERVEPVAVDPHRTAGPITVRHVTPHRNAPAAHVNYRRGPRKSAAVTVSRKRERRGVTPAECPACRGRQHMCRAHELGLLPA